MASSRQSANTGEVAAAFGVGHRINTTSRLRLALVEMKNMGVDGLGTGYFVAVIMMSALESLTPIVSRFPCTQ